MLNKKAFLGISWKELLAVIGIYFALSWFYRITLWSSFDGNGQNWERLFDLSVWWDSGGLQYSIMFLGMAIVWFLVFRIFRHWKLRYRLLLHLIGLPIFIFFSWKVYYFICDYYGYGHLEGDGQKWDIYIPALFYLLQFAFFHAYEYYVINQRKMRLEIELKNLALKNELSAIKAQLNPHFLYNVFNTINASVPQEMEETREMIAQLSDLFRYQLKASKEEKVSLREELDFVRKYLKLEKYRFRERLQTQITVPDTLLNQPVPPMILQPIVENAVKHGISPQIEGGRVNIEITKVDDKLIFEISDTGVGLDDPADEAWFKKGVGLGNTQLRLKKMYATGLRLSHNQPRGLTVKFSL